MNAGQIPEQKYRRKKQIIINIDTEEIDAPFVDYGTVGADNSRSYKEKATNLGPFRRSG